MLAYILREFSRRMQLIDIAHPRQLIQRWNPRGRLRIYRYVGPGKVASDAEGPLGFQCKAQKSTAGASRRECESGRQGKGKAGRKTRNARGAGARFEREHPSRIEHGGSCTPEKPDGRPQWQSAQRQRGKHWAAAIYTRPRPSAEERQTSGANQSSGTRANDETGHTTDSNIRRDRGSRIHKGPAIYSGAGTFQNQV